MHSLRVVFREIRYKEEKSPGLHRKTVQPGAFRLRCPECGGTTRYFFSVTRRKRLRILKTERTAGGEPAALRYQTEREKERRVSRPYPAERL